MEESDVGISCYVSRLPGFRGILKHRFSDFIVNEVDIDGKIVHLTCLDEEMGGREVVSSAVDTDSDASKMQKLKEIAGDEDAEIVRNFVDDVSLSSVALSADSDKAHRAEIHKFFKENFKFVLADTVDGPDGLSKRIRLRRIHAGGGREQRKRKNGGGDGGRRHDCWPTETGKFLRFNLYKENKNTQEALGVIGKMLGVRPKSFGFSGTKDKRSVSTQRVTVFKQRAHRLSSLNRRLHGLKVGDFRYVSEPLFLGRLRGNRFTIVLRGVVAKSDDLISTAARSLGSHGFINYFGLQRFGSGPVPTHVIGAALLRGEWSEAVRMILRSATENGGHWTDDRPVTEALKKLPRNRIAERAILESLKRQPDEYLQALMAIPRTMRTMYVHSYQSYLWNHAATYRVQEYGAHQVVCGDLVFESEASIEEQEQEEHEEEEVERGSSGKQVTAVDDDDAGCGKYKAGDVVLPLPGGRTVYPSNGVGGIYHELARKDGISLVEAVHKVKEFSITAMSGGYRRVLQRPVDLDWELLTYGEPDEPLTVTDLDRISPASIVVASPPALLLSSSSEPGDDAKSSFRALKLEFTLPPSSYATMAVRELLKSSTSVAFQKTQSLTESSVKSASD